MSIDKLIDQPWFLLTLVALGLILVGVGLYFLLRSRTPSSDEYEGLPPYVATLANGCKIHSDMEVAAITPERVTFANSSYVSEEGVSLVCRNGVGGSIAVVSPRGGVSVMSAGANSTIRIRS